MNMGDGNMGHENMGHGNMAGTTTTTEANHGNMVTDINDVIAQLIGAGWTEAPDCAPDRA